MSEDHAEKKTKSAKDLSSESLYPIRVWASSERGSINKIATEITRLSGSKVSRHQVGRWLTEKEENRIQPSHGNALLLMMATRNIQTGLV